MKLIELDRPGIGRDLLKVRQFLKLSLAEVATRASIAPSHLWSLERGIKDVSLQKLSTICGLLGLPLAQLIYDNLLISRDLLFERACSDLDIAATTEEEARARKARSADYAAGAAVILTHVIAAQGAQFSERFDYPGQVFADAVGLVITRFETATIPERFILLANMRDHPVAALNSIGMWTRNLLQEFFFWSRLAKRSPWIPSKQKGVDEWLRRTPDYQLAFASPETVGATMREVAKEFGLTEASMAGNIKPVTLRELRIRLSQVLEPGKQSELARFLGAPLASVSRWLSGKREPGGEIALSMLAWVQGEERKQRNPGRASTRPGPKAQPKERYATNQKSGRQKR